MLYDGAVGPSREKFFDKEYYRYNKLYPWSVLKLHGSLNWWQFTKYSPNTSLKKREIKHRFLLNKDNISLQERDFSPDFGTWSLREQLYLEPIIITPDLQKT